jgi:FtsH-binding integral membrane protein
VLFSLLFALILSGLLSIFWHSRVLDIAISGIGAAVFAAYICFDVQVRCVCVRAWFRGGWLRT